MGLLCCEPPRKFGTWSRICDPGDRSPFIFDPVCFTRLRQGDPVLGKEVWGFRQRAINFIDEADRGSVFSHGSVPLARSASCSGFREWSVGFVLPSQSVFWSQLVVPC